MGIWLFLFIIDSIIECYYVYFEWVVKDFEGNFIVVQWGYCGFDMVSGFQ